MGALRLTNRIVKVRGENQVLTQVPEAIRTEAVCLAAVQQDKDAIKYVPKHLKARILFLEAKKYFTLSSPDRPM
ncbi:MAG: hypothetical protein LBQ82_08150 [Treponema sp.]|jgi:hypothetical protein|nr:hypothetical protein [Treponema sp.]